VTAPRQSSWEVVRLVVAREFFTRVRERAFRTSTLVILLILGAVIVLPNLAGLTRFTVGVVGDDARQVVESAKAQAELAKITVNVRQLPDDATARAQAGRGDIAAAVTSDGTILTRQYVPDQLKPFLLGAVQDAALQKKLRGANVDPNLLAIPPPNVVSIRPDSESAQQRRNLAFIGIMVLFGQLFGFGTQVAMGVVEEKSSRVVEVVLSAIRPVQLLVGKVIGIGLVGLLQLGIVGAVGAVVANRYGMLDLTTGNLATFGQIGVWFLLGFAFLGALFAGVGATVSRQEDLQQAMAPLATINFASVFLGIYASQHPTTVLTTVLSYVPPFSPIVMTPRWAGGGVPTWQVLLSMGIMVVSTVVVARVAARLYQGAVLQLGARLALRDAFSRSS
jgi:ABC-2 type transport system permease protein